MLLYTQQAKTLSEQLAYITGKAEAEINEAAYYRNKGDYPRALEGLLDVLNIYDSLQLQTPFAGTHLSIAQVYKDMAGDIRTMQYLEKGLKYSKTAYDLYDNLQDTAGMMNALNMSGILYRDIGFRYKKPYYDTAHVQYTRALNLYELSGKGYEFLGKIYNNISQVYNEYKKDYPTALEYLFKAVAFNEKNHNATSLTYNYGNISDVYVRMNQHEKALLYARKMLQAAEEVNIATRLRDAYFQLYRSYRAVGRYDSALSYYRSGDYLDDSLTNVVKTRQVMDLQTLYETREKEAEINQLQIDSSNQNKRIAFLAIGLLLFALLAGSMILLYRRVKQQQQQILAQSQRLEVMMKELHHRVKNNLQIVSSLLSLQTYKMTDKGAISVLNESRQRVQAMSFIHQRLYKKESLTAVNMKEYLTDLSESLVQSYGYNSDNFNLDIQVDKEMMDIDKALPIGLIINEMVTNALKYAYESVNRPCLQIILTEDETGAIRFSVKDNGIGINEDMWKEKSNSFGKQLITALCKQLRAKQTMVVDGGTRFSVVIPKQVA